MRFRLLPLTILTAAALFAVKLGDLVQNGSAISQAIAAPAEAKPEAGKPAAEAAAAEAKTDAATVTPPETPAAKPPKPGDITAAKPEDKGARKEFSPVEVDLLQSLSRRRDELDQWARNIEMKEALLKATEQRLDTRMKELESLRGQMSTLLAQYNEKEDAKIRSLVKIYENMKPKDAARIFDTLDMPVLLEVVDKMSERKVAPVLAAMNPTKAKNVTIELADQRRVKKPLDTALVDDPFAEAAPSTPSISPLASAAPTQTAAAPAVETAQPAAAEEKALAPASPAAATKTP